MAPKRVSPLDEPPAASSSEEEAEASTEEAESGSGSGSDESESDAETSKPAPAVQDKKPEPKKPESAAKPQASSSSGETETESESESDGETLAKTKLHVKPIASKPMEEVTPPPKATRPRSKPAASPAKSGTKRPIGGEGGGVKDAKKAKKGDEQEEDGVEEESKKSKLFQRLWSDEDEIVILKGMKDYAAKNGVVPHGDMTAFHEYIKKSLKVEVSKTQLQDKIRRMKKKFENNVTKKTKPTKDHDIKTFELSKKVWGGEEDLAGQVTVTAPAKVEQPKLNGKVKAKAKAKSNQKENSKTLTSLKAELLSSPERLKEAEKGVAFLKPCASGSVSSEVVGFDKGFKELGLSETIVQQGLELIGESKCAELKDKWNKLHVAELEVFVKRTELMRDQAEMILEALKSEH